MNLTQSSNLLTPGAFALGLGAPAAEPQVIRIQRVHLLWSPQGSPSAADAALKSLRGFRAGRRRAVWWNTADLARTPNTDFGAWGRKLVEVGGADVAVICGVGARDLAVAARDAGLPIGRVVVCGDDATARNVLCDSIAAGDAVLLLGVAPEGCQRLTERLESRFERELVGAK